MEAVNDVLLQAASVVTALTILVGAAVGGARLRFVRWTFRRLVGEPVLGWVDTRITKHTDPILAVVSKLEPVVAELVPNGGESWRDHWEKDRKEIHRSLRRLDKRTSDTQKLVTEAAQLYVAVNEAKR